MYLHTHIHIKRHLPSPLCEHTQIFSEQLQQQLCGEMKKRKNTHTCTGKPRRRGRKRNKNLTENTHTHAPAKHIMTHEHYALVWLLPE